MVTDRVTRLNPKTGQMIDYLLRARPTSGGFFVDNTHDASDFWVGSNHGASIVKLEVLD